MAPAVIYIVRHGETDSNRSGIIQGHLDTHLNSEGLAQAQRVADVLKSTPFDIAFSSDLSRTVETAEAILRYHPEVRLQKVEALRERNMGELQGKVFSSEAMTKYSHTMERSEDLSARASKWWSATLQRLSALQAHQEQPYNVLIVSHGGWIQTLVRTLVNSRKLKVAQDVTIDSGCLNVSVTKIETDGNRKGVVIKYGDVSHLITRAVASNADVLT